MQWPEEELETDRYARIVRPPGQMHLITQAMIVPFIEFHCVVVHVLFEWLSEILAGAAEQKAREAEDCVVILSQEPLRSLCAIVASHHCCELVRIGAGLICLSFHML